jgi:hypothetical protein
MKHILKYTCLITLSLLVTVACEDKDAVRFPDLQSGINARTILYPERSYINFDDLANASVAFDVYSINKDIDAIVYSVTYTDASDPNTTYPELDAIEVTQADFVNGKATEVEITAAELAALFNLPGGTAHLDGGDFFVFNVRAELADGRVISAINSAPSITGGANASFTTTFTTFVGCPSAITEGVYIASQNDADAWFGGATTKEVTITRVAGHPFNYIISDVSAGGYGFCCAALNYSANQPAQISDICGQILVTGAAGSQINASQGASPGTWDPSTQTLTVHYEDALNTSLDFGVDLVSVFVKKP